MDMENREVIGRAVSDKLNSELVRSAFESALMNRGSLEGYIHHTDSDRRYCSHEYIELLNNSKYKFQCVLVMHMKMHTQNLLIKLSSIKR
ncbi:MAG: hypothetical protein HS129_09435 [Leptospiraceae bacterium]|nr:hypothetical protein [Leptospiraceae bacterium]